VKNSTRSDGTKDEENASEWISTVIFFPADGGRRIDGSANQSRMESFSTGQVFNSSKAQQVHVLPSVVPGDNS